MTYLWFHDKLRKHFFFMEDGRITHCYRLEYSVEGNCDCTRWWQVPIPQKHWAQREKLRLVFSESEIGHQLTDLYCTDFPPAGWFFKPGSFNHPRYNQWQELNPMEKKREHWGKCGRTPRLSSLFVSNPHARKELR